MEAVFVNSLLRLHPPMRWYKKFGKKKVLITGFGLFDDLEYNLSWDGVNSMDKENIEKKFGIELHLEKVEVEYAEVDRKASHWKKALNPDLTIHVGVDEVTSFRIEKRARKHGYDDEKKKDRCGKHPKCFQNSSKGPKVIYTNLDVADICDEFNKRPSRLTASTNQLEAEESSDAGRFVCEYIYYSSLSRGTTLFVHVPKTTVFCSALEVAEALERILELCLHQLPAGIITREHYHYYCNDIEKKNALEIET